MFRWITGQCVGELMNTVNPCRRLSTGLDFSVRKWTAKLRLGFPERLGAALTLRLDPFSAWVCFLAVQFGVFPDTLLLLERLTL